LRSMAAAAAPDNAILLEKCFWENMSAAPTCAKSKFGDSYRDLYKEYKRIQAKRRAEVKKDDEE
jgi:hypothetical protein